MPARAARPLASECQPAACGSRKEEERRRRRAICMEERGLGSDARCTCSLYLLSISSISRKSAAFCLSNIESFSLLAAGEPFSPPPQPLPVLDSAALSLLRSSAICSSLSCSIALHHSQPNPPPPPLTSRVVGSHLRSSPSPPTSPSTRRAVSRRRRRRRFLPAPPPSPHPLPSPSLSSHPSARSQC